MPNLVGIGNSQVPTNAMLGGLAYQDPESANLTNVQIENIDKIKAEMNLGASCLFVYDTRKDSDGGAWRYKCKDSSWYNEEFTSARGSKKQFPAVALIVGHVNFFMIMDLDDPNCPMWMAGWQYLGGAGSGTSTNWWGGSGDVLGVTAANGQIGICLSTSVRLFNFPKDRIDLWYTPASGQYGIPGGISERNIKYVAWQENTDDYMQISTSGMRNIASRVLPGASIDRETGLPRPTFAVCHDAGIDVITDQQREGQEKEHFRINRSSDDNVHTVSISKYGHIYQAMDMGSVFVNFPRTYNWSGNPAYATRIYGGSGNNTGEKPNLSAWGGIRTVVATKDGFAAYSDVHGSSAFSGGLNIVAEPFTSDGAIYPGKAENGLDTALGMVAVARTDSNSGYVVGDGRMSLMCQTVTDSFDVGSVTASSSFNEEFSNNDNGWTFADNSGGGISSGSLTIKNITSARATLANWGGTQGSAYVAEVYITTNGSSGSLLLDDDGAGAGVGGNTTYMNSTTVGGAGQTGRFVFNFTRTASSRLRFMRNTGGDFVIDHLRIAKREVFDGSYGRDNAAIIGTLTRERVAPGADLMAYRGFSSTGYILQAHNSNLNFGTGNWCYYWWMKPNNSSNGTVIFSRHAVSTGSNTRVMVYFNSDRVRFDVTESGGSSYHGMAPGDGNHLTNRDWMFCAVVRRGNGYELWINGRVEQSHTANSTSDGSQTDGEAVLRIGEDPHTGGENLNMWITLLRASATAPSETQMRKIYSDEKKLFTENAKCTLIGTDEQLNALAYDEDNDIVYAGTDTGRSDFRGLCRINSTNNAITAALSAANGYVAEE